MLLTFLLRNQEYPRKPMVDMINESIDIINSTPEAYYTWLWKDLLKGTSMKNGVVQQKIIRSI